MFSAIRRLPFACQGNIKPRAPSQKLMEPLGIISFRRVHAAWAQNVSGAGGNMRLNRYPPRNDLCQSISIQSIHVNRIAWIV